MAPAFEDEDVFGWAGGLLLPLFAVWVVPPASFVLAVWVGIGYGL